ncbi:unnamed protein product, partial [Rotaria sp. Silwood2]
MNKQTIDTSSSEQQHSHTIVNACEDSAIVNTTINNKEKEAESLLDEYQVEPSSAGFFLCSNLAARHAVAIWAF